MNDVSTYDAPGCAGAIEIESAPGCDTTVEFSVSVREIVPNSGTSGTKRSLRILCVDDDPHVREFMNACLLYYNHQVVVASGGRQGLDMFRAAMTENQPYDAVITDLGMPDVNGHQLARAIKAESPDLPIILMTGWGAVLDEDEISAPGVDIVVNKPPCMAELNVLLLKMAAPVYSARKEGR